VAIANLLTVLAIRRLPESRDMRLDETSCGSA